MHIAVVGLGKIGLPLAVQYAARDHKVVGADVNGQTVDSVNSGREPFPGEAGLAELLSETVKSGSFTATKSTTGAVALAAAVVVAVPLFTDVTGTPDFGILDAATSDVASGLKPGSLVSYETTLPVGSVRNRFAPALERGSGLVEGRDFHVVFSPERVLTGRVFADLRRYPKLIGALSADGAQVGRKFYESVLEFDPRPDLPIPNGVWDLGTAEAAELAKLAETTYRDVNIGLANQFAVFADANGIDIHAVIRACNSQPYSHIHQPGVSVGGHCIPIYPRLYLWNDPTATVISAARDQNASMPAYAVHLLERLLGRTGSLQGVTVVVLGAAYRPGVKETAFSGVFPVVSELESRGATALVHDPLYEPEELRALGLAPYIPGHQAYAAILHTEHREYASWGPGHLPGVIAFVDGRGLTSPESWPGVRWTRLGEGALAHSTVTASNDPVEA